MILIVVVQEGSERIFVADHGEVIEQPEARKEVADFCDLLAKDDSITQYIDSLQAGN